MDHRGTIKSIGIGGICFVLGAAVGASFGLIYAPHSGKITRGIMDEKIHEAVRKADKIIDEARDRAEDFLKRAHVRR